MGDDPIVNSAVLGPEILELEAYRSTKSLPATAHDLHQQCIVLSHNIGMLSVELGLRLWHMREHRLFEHLGFETFNDYLDSPELAMSRQHLYKLLRVAEVLCPQLTKPENGQMVFDVDPGEVAAIGVTKANIVAGYVKNLPEEERPDAAREWVSRASTLTKGDLQMAMIEAQNPEITQAQGAAYTLGNKLAAMAFHLRGTHGNPIPVLDELIAEANTGRAWLVTVLHNGPHRIEDHVK